MKRYIKATRQRDSVDLGNHFGSSWEATTYDSGEIYVRSVHPYDLQEYHWARSYDGGATFEICINPEFVYNGGGQRGPRRIKIIHADEDQEYMDVVAELAQLDRGIDPRIDHT